MKLVISILLALSVFQVHADDVNKLKIKEIRTHLETVNPDSTCMDEYLTRRNQLIAKLALSPLTIAAGSVVSTYMGALTGAGINLVGSITSWDALGVVILGGFAGAVAGVTLTTTDSVMAGVTLYKHTLVVKSVAEYELNRGEYYSNKLYEGYSIQSNKDHVLPLPKELFVKELVELDSAGTLCDGSLVKQPRIKIGPKLKFKVAKSKDIFRKINETKR